MANAEVVKMSGDTVDLYRRAVNAMSGIFRTNWLQVSEMTVQRLEELFHDTTRRDHTRYGTWFARNFPKMPSYLRRAATMAAHGHVSSFMTRYRAWQGGDRRSRSSRPPGWGAFNGWPVLYAANGGAGAMIRRDGDSVHLKLYDATTGQWSWHATAVTTRGRRHGGGHAPLSPALVVRGSRLALAQPYELRRAKHGKPSDRVCAVDLGINTQATAVVLDAFGTVIARRFFHLGAHIDRRDKALCRIREKAALTMGRGGKLGDGFCRALYARAAGLNTHMARELSRQMLGFAEQHGADTLVFEDLKGFRPKGGNGRTPMKQRFHGWLHRKLVKQAEVSAEERDMHVAFVHARGTSSWAYDGSGKVRRAKHNHALATFASGKRYNCDLSAACNIGARHIERSARLAATKAVAEIQEPAVRNPGWAARGKRTAGLPATTAAPRMPVTLSTLWREPLRTAA